MTGRTCGKSFKKLIEKLSAGGGGGGGGLRYGLGLWLCLRLSLVDLRGWLAEFAKVFPVRSPRFRLTLPFHIPPLLVGSQPIPIYHSLQTELASSFSISSL